MPTLKRKPKIHIKNRNGKKTQRVYRGGGLGLLTEQTAKDLFKVSGGEMKTLLGIKNKTEYDPEEHDGFRVLALNKERRKKITIGKSYLGAPVFSGEITNEKKVEYFLNLLNANTQGVNTKNYDNTKWHADMGNHNLKKALANIRLMIYKMEIEADGANLEKLENDIVHIFFALDSRTSGAEAATALASANTAATTGAVAVEDNEAEEEGKTESEEE